MTQTSINWDDGLRDFQKKHPEHNINAMTRKLWWDLIKQNYPDEFILLQEFIPCSSKDFKDLSQIFPAYKSIPTFGETGFFITNQLTPDFLKIVPLDLPEPFRKNCIDYMKACWSENKPFAYLNCLEDYKNGKF